MLKLSIGFPFLVVVFAAFPLRIRAQAPCDFRPCQSWGAIGAAGIVDESSLGLFTFSDTGSVFFRSSALGTIQLRYPVLPVGIVQQDQSGETNPGGNFCLGVQYRDTGAGSRVIVSLKSVHHNGGQVFTYGTFDSDLGIPTGDAYETSVNCRLTDETGAPAHVFDMLHRAYYVAVRLMRGSSSANPGLKSVFLITNSLNP